MVHGLWRKLTVQITHRSHSYQHAAELPVMLVSPRKFIFTLGSALTVTFRALFLTQRQNSRGNKCHCCRVDLTIFIPQLHEVLGLYRKIQLSQPNKDTAGLNSQFSVICPFLKRQRRSEVNPLLRSVRKSKEEGEKKRIMPESPRRHLRLSH